MSDSQTVNLDERLKRLSPEKRALLELLSNRTKVSGHQLVVRTLLANGVTHIYAVSGGPINETLAAAVAAGIRVIGTRHQQAAVLMALSHNYTAGRVNAVVIVSAGPAVTNAATGLLVARDNAWPVVVLGGCYRGVVEGHGFQELDAARLYASITKWSQCASEISAIPHVINKAFEVATSGRPGPVYLDVPEDVLRMSCRHNPTEPLCSLASTITAVETQVDETAALLRNAGQPAIIIGKGTRWSLVPEELARLIEQHQIAFISSPMGRGILPDEHPLCFNRAKQQLQATADVILILGARLNWTFRFGCQINPRARVIQVDIDSEEARKNKKVTLAIVADAGEFVARLGRALQERPKKELLTARKIWHRSLASVRDRQRSLVDERAMSERLPLSPYRLMKELNTSIPADAILVVDGNISLMAAQHVIPGQTPFSRFTSATNGCMGVGIPFGIGARLADPSRPVVVISGDMAFGISAMELETAVRCAAPVIVIVANNEGISGGSQQRELYPAGHERVAMFEPEISYEKIAEAFGADGEYIDQPDQIRPAVERALISDKPTVINVKVDPYETFMSEL